MKAQLEKQAKKLKAELEKLQTQIAALPVKDPFKKFKTALKAGKIVVFGTKYSNKQHDFEWGGSAKLYRIIPIPKEYTFWQGGENPCHPNDIVSYIMLNGSVIIDNNKASELRWIRNYSNSDIVAYKIVEKYIPDGYTEFRSSIASTQPNSLNDKDTIEIIDSNKKKTISLVNNIWWRHFGSQTHVIAYRVLKKYVEPRALTFAEIPIGTMFQYTYKNLKSNNVYIKISNNDDRNACNLTSGGCLDSFLINNKFAIFHEIVAEFKIGKKLTTKE